MRVKNCAIRVKAAGEQDDTGNGEFEAIVATYDLDSYGDKIVPGAFAKTLEDWKASGDPIPVIWSHMSYDPDAHIGVVVDAKETDDGLWVKGRLDLDQPKAAQVYRLMKGRRVTQFSFAYDVEEGAWIEKADDRPYYELRQLKLYEVGPCLIGVNQETELLAVKAADGRDLNLAVTGRSIAPGEADTIRIAVEAALKAASADPRHHRATADNQAATEAAEAKAGRVLSAKNETALSEALAQISAGSKGIKAVLDSIGTSDDDKSADTSNAKTENEAKPDRSATDEAPEGKSDRPAGVRPASLRLSTDADIAALDAEFGD
ncbi:HK97 family phage prohead protease [Pseudonocardia sp. D17]|uniref:HK97 family phage prohead protease n=1 Tax=Pseudonocardia sp. D17 TaxID=882661 RepID=UPI002B3F7652|nr:hypothetical protein PSD17_39070 [Pseudonocardia sp. D17]